MRKSLDQMMVVTEDPLNAETPISALLGETTPSDLFYVRNHFDIPSIEKEDWKLEFLAGAKSRLFTLDEIKSFPHQSHRVVLECAGNGRVNLDPPVQGTAWGLGAVSQAEFVGTSLRNILDTVDISANVTEVVFTGMDSGKLPSGKSTSYARSLPLAKSVAPDVLLVWEMNGEQLPREHGFPLRLIVPRYYGMASVKWLKYIELAEQPFQGFFQSQEYVYTDVAGSPNGVPVTEIRARSIFTSHSDGELITKGKHQISGLARSGQGAVTEVGLSLDHGTTWRSADLSRAISPNSWVRWQKELNFHEAGEQSILLRARDDSGAIQPLEQYWNQGGYGNNVVQKLILGIK